MARTAGCDQQRHRHLALQADKVEMPELFPFSDDDHHIGAPSCVECTDVISHR